MQEACKQIHVNGVLLRPGSGAWNPKALYCGVWGMNKSGKRTACCDLQSFLSAFWLKGIPSDWDKTDGGHICLLASKPLRLVHAAMNHHDIYHLQHHGMMGLTVKACRCCAFL